MSSSDTVTSDFPEQEFVVIDGIEIPLVEPSGSEQRLLRKQKLPILCKADKSNGWSAYLLSRHLSGARSVNRLVPRWKSKSMPVALLLSCRGNHARRKLLQKCLRVKHPVVLIYMDGGLPGLGICPGSLRHHFGLGSNVIIFAWTTRPTDRQFAVLNFLYAHWQEVPYDAMQWLRNRSEIPFFGERPE